MHSQSQSLVAPTLFFVLWLVAFLCFFGNLGFTG